MTEKADGKNNISPVELIDARIKELGDWRSEMLARLRILVHQATPDVIEECKWRGVPVWYLDGMVCTGETYKTIVKVTFAKGVSLSDPTELFNASLDGNTRRSIDFHEGDNIDEEAFKSLVHEAIVLNRSASQPSKKSRKEPLVRKQTSRKVPVFINNIS